MAGFDESNTDYTRRSHIVRVSEAGASGASGGTGGGDGASGGGGTYVDIEVLDAIAFRIEGNKEVILDMSKPVPFRTDDTGDGNDDTSAGSLATRRSHMKRITSTDGTKFFDIEVIDAAAFRDQNGYEWILTMPTADQDASDFNSTDDTGNSDATRRVHTELISQDLTDQKPTDYLKVIRNDAMSFRGPGNREVILVTPSNNDPNASDKAAATFTTPQNYDPADSAGSPPPAPDDSEPGVYFAFVDGSDGIFTNDDATIEMGPLWWIRKVGAGAILFVLVEYQINTTGAVPVRPTVTLKMPYGIGTWDVLTSVNETLPGIKPVPVVNPVTDKMLASMYQWTPGTPFETPQAPPDGNTQTFYLVTDSYFPRAAVLDYGIDPVPFPTAQNYNLSANFPDFFNMPGATIQDAWYPTELGGQNGLTGSYIAFWENLGVDPFRLQPLTQGNHEYASQSDADFVAAADLAYWTSVNPFGGIPDVIVVRIDVSQPGTGQLAGRAIFEMNLSQVIPAIQASAVEGQPPPPLQFELDVTLSAPTDAAGDFSGAQLGVTAQAFKTLRDFPINPVTGLPTFPFPDPSPTSAKDGKSDSTSIGASTGKTISNKIFGTIDPKTFDIKLTVA